MYAQVDALTPPKAPSSAPQSSGTPATSGQAAAEAMMNIEAPTASPHSLISPSTSPATGTLSNNERDKEREKVLYTSRVMLTSKSRRAAHGTSCLWLTAP